MKIRYKTIEHERTQDSPFIGAVISAIDCWENCANCFNQHLKSQETLEANVDEIITIVKSNPLNQGIILAGLEWTLQPDEMLALLYRAKRAGLKTMLYTDMTGNEFNRWLSLEIRIRMPHDPAREPVHTNKYISAHLDYIKFGPYDETKKSENYSSYGVNLASTNQYIMEVSHGN